MDERYNIGILVNNGDERYIGGIVDGMRSVLAPKGHNLFVLSGTLQQYDIAQDAHLDYAFMTAAALDLDVYIVPVGMFNAHRRDDDTKSQGFLYRLPKEKVIVIEETVPGYRSIGKENATGIHLVMEHLVEHHHYRRIGMISGAVSSGGAQQREAAFAEDMRRYGLPMDEHTIVHARFDGGCLDLIDDYVAAHPDLEAIVCGNDTIAGELYQVLKTRGLRPGRDIAVTGYDDMEGASLMDPPLTTVSLSPFMLGQAAGRDALRLAEGLPQTTSLLSGTLSHRYSCGESRISEADIYRGLLTRDPFPAREMADLLTERIVRGNSVDDYLDLRDALQEMVTAYHDGLRDLAQINQYSARRVVSLLAKYGRRASEELYFNAMNDYLSALADVAPAGERENALRIATYFAQSVARRSQSQQVEKVAVVTARQWTINSVVRETIEAGLDQGKVMTGIANALAEIGFKYASLLTFAQPLLLSDTNLPLPPSMNLRLVLGDGKSHVFSDEGKSVPIRGIIGNFASHAEGGLYKIIGLNDQKGYNGILIAEISSDAAGSFYFSSLQSSYALDHIRMVEEQDHLIQMLNRSNSSLVLESSVDPLTQLLNRRGFFRELGDVLERKDSPCGAIFYADVNSFKSVNDTYGHNEGDQAIVAVADLIKSAIGGDALVSRFGGDEYVFFIPAQHDIDTAKTIVNVKAAIARYNANGDKPYDLSLSIGACAFRIAPNVDIEAKNNEADEALLREKRAWHRNH